MVAVTLALVSVCRWLNYVTFCVVYAYREKGNIFRLQRFLSFIPNLNKSAKLTNLLQSRTQRTKYHQQTHTTHSVMRLMFCLRLILRVIFDSTSTSSLWSLGTRSFAVLFPVHNFYSLTPLLAVIGCCR